MAALRQRCKGSTRSTIAYMPRDLVSINLIGPDRAQSRIGESFRSTVRACQAAEIRASVYDSGSPERLRSFGDWPPENLNTDHRDAIFNILHFAADFLPTVRSIFGSGFFSHRYNIGYWVWEMEYLPKSWRPYVESFNEVWTPSTFCLDIFSREVHVPVIRMPHNVAPKPPDGINRRELGLPERGFIFLVMADFKSLAERKNPLGAIEAFSRMKEWRL